MQRRRVRVCFAMGPAQVFFMSAALRQAGDAGEVGSHLVLFGDKPGDALRVVMTHIAEAAGEWASVVWADDVLSYELLHHRANIAPVARQLRKRVGIDDADELWVCRLDGGPEQAAQAAYPRSHLVLCEDGLATYSQLRRQWTDALVHPRRSLRFVSDRLVRCAAWLPAIRDSHHYRWPVRPASRAFLLLAGLLPAPTSLEGVEIRRVERTATTAVIDDVRAARGFPVSAFAPASGARRVLMLGQCFSRWGTMPREDELDVYRRACAELIERGCRILWKEHPKANEPFHPDLAAALPGIDLFPPDLHVWPVEFFIPDLDVDACVSLTSTALMSLRAIHDTPCFTMAERILPHLRNRRGERERRSAEFMAKHAAPVETYLAGLGAV